jgi:hypothetical protein
MNTTSRFLTVLVVLATTSVAYADPSKEECLDAHSRGQDAKEQGKLSLARKLFLQCAQSSCPGLVQGDCSKFADDLSRLQPSITLVARDGQGADLPDTTVYIDDMLVATRLDDGRPHDVDPGKHIVKFTNGGRDQSVTVVIGSGEQGRPVIGTFGSPASAPASGSVRQAVLETPPAPRMVHPLGARALLYGGAALTVLGAAYATFEMTRIPSECSLGSHECSAAPGDPVFNTAHSAVIDADLGWVAAGVGLAAVVGGAIWYFKSGKLETQEHLAITPWFAPGTGGLAVGGSL